MVSFEIFVKSMPPSLSELKVLPSFFFAFKIPDDHAVTSTYYVDKCWILQLFVTFCWKLIDVCNELITSKGRNRPWVWHPIWHHIFTIFEVEKDLTFRNLSEHNLRQHFSEWRNWKPYPTLALYSSGRQVILFFFKIFKKRFLLCKPYIPKLFY